MSDLRVALVAEGPLDRVIIEAALKAIIPRPFILTLLQPEPTDPRPTNGWCGVLRWCRQFAARAHAGLETDPTLAGFDVYVIHLDADVADCSYADGGHAVARDSVGWPPLPCSLPCPPAADSVNELRKRLIAWLGLVDLGPRTVICVPSKASDAWLAAAVLDETHGLLHSMECTPSLATQLAALPKQQRIKKSQLAYQGHAGTMTRHWARVTRTCTQAQRFHSDLRLAIGAGEPLQSRPTGMT
jgi:hypothetical protein